MNQIIIHYFEVDYSLTFQYIYLIADFLLNQMTLEVVYLLHLYEIYQMKSHK